METPRPVLVHALLLATSVDIGSLSCAGHKSTLVGHDKPLRSSGQLDGSGGSTTATFGRRGELAVPDPRSRGWAEEDDGPFGGVGSTSDRSAKRTIQTPAGRQILR